MDSNKTFVFFNTSEKDSVDYSQLITPGPNISNDETQAWVGWEGEIPLSILNLQTKGDYLTEQELIHALHDSNWIKIQTAIRNEDGTITFT
jgi:hypothetical protein